MNQQKVMLRIVLNLIHSNVILKRLHAKMKFGYMTTEHKRLITLYTVKVTLSSNYLLYVYRLGDEGQIIHKFLVRSYFPKVSF